MKINLVSSLIGLVHGNQLKKNLEANGLDGELIAMEPIAEGGAYLERQAPVWCITSTCENPEAVFDIFFETMLDGGEGQDYGHMV